IATLLDRDGLAGHELVAGEAGYVKRPELGRDALSFHRIGECRALHGSPGHVPARRERDRNPNGAGRTTFDVAPLGTFGSLREGLLDHRVVDGRLSGAR